MSQTRSEQLLGVDYLSNLVTLVQIHDIYRQTSIHDFPVEILRVILRLCTVEHRMSPIGFRFHDPHQSLALSHVCRFWRECCISDAFLWCHVHPSNVCFATLCISRSQNAGLDLMLGHNSACCGYKNKPFQDPEATYEFILRNICRAVRLEAMPHEKNIGPLLKIFWTSPAPRLEACFFEPLDQFGTPDEVIARIFEELTIDTNAIFCGLTPRLRSVVWSGYLPDPRFNFWSNLEHIEISWMNSYYRLSIQEIISMLTRSPNIQRIDVTANDISIDYLSIPAIIRPRPLLLKNLTTLRLIVEILPQLDLFFEAFELSSFPTLNSVSLLLGRPLSDGLSCKAMVERYPSLHSLFQQLLHCTISYYVEDTVYIAGHNSCNGTPTKLYHENRVYLSLSVANELLPKFFNDIATLMPSLLCLQLKFPFDLPIRLGSAELVTTLDLSRNKTFSALNEFLTRNPLPSLNEIILPNLAAPPSSRALEALKDILSSRSSNGNNIRLFQCNQNFELQ